MMVIDFYKFYKFPHTSFVLTGGSPGPENMAEGGGNFPQESSLVESEGNNSLAGEQLSQQVMAYKKVRVSKWFGS